MKIALPALADLNQLKLFINNTCKELLKDCTFITDIEDNIDILILNKPIDGSIQKWVSNTIDKGYIILNSDEQILNTSFFLDGKKLITVGLDQKSTITASSIVNNTVQICIQRNIVNINNSTVCEQEFSFEALDISINNLLIFVSLLIVLDKLQFISIDE